MNVGFLKWRMTMDSKVKSDWNARIRIKLLSTLAVGTTTKHIKGEGIEAEMVNEF